MERSLWIYEISPWLAFMAAFALLFGLSYAGYRLGSRIRGQGEESPFHMAEFIPSTVLGMLALILGFTFSMAISRFEQRRQLVIEEANAIGTTELRARLLRAPHGARVRELLRRYLDARIEFYEDRSPGARVREMETRIAGLQGEIWNATVEATKEDRGAIESIFVNSLNSMLDLRIDRNIALKKTLPPMIYWSILFISGIGLMAFSFARGERKERGQWQPAILVLMVSFVFYLILDIERPREGAIRISQEAMLALRDSWDR